LEFSKYIVAKRQLEEFKLAKNINTKWRLKSNTMFVLIRNRDNKYTMQSLIWDKKTWLKP
jgi:hypothetical protein